jgi:hypothetical protein
MTSMGMALITEMEPAMGLFIGWLLDLNDTHSKPLFPALINVA